jgi:hypothetical protein
VNAVVIWAVIPEQYRNPILLTTQYTAYPTPRPSGNMTQGRHQGDRLNVQANIPAANRPNIMPIMVEII